MTLVLVVAGSDEVVGVEVRVVDELVGDEVGFDSASEWVEAVGRGPSVVCGGGGVVVAGAGTGPVGGLGSGRTAR